MSQFNIAIATLIIGSYILINKEKECWAALCIAIGTFVKIYGIIALALFVFVKHKKSFIFWLLIWSIVLFIAPMLISSPDYIISHYSAWFDTLLHKNDGNMFSPTTNISVLGMIRKMTHNSTYSDLWVILCGLVVFSLPFLRFKQYKNLAFQLGILSSCMMFVVLFSTGSESSGYIIPFVGVAIWYWSAPWKRNKWDVSLMIFAFILTSMSPSDLFPKIIRLTLVRPYALKALPIFIIWLKLSYELCKRDYRTKEVHTN